MRELNSPHKYIFVANSVNQEKFQKINLFHYFQQRLHSRGHTATFRNPDTPNRYKHGAVFATRPHSVDLRGHTVSFPIKVGHRVYYGYVNDSTDYDFDSWYRAIVKYNPYIIAENYYAKRKTLDSDTV